MAIDRLGQEVKVGDWAAITQNNEVYVGKVIRAADSITIAQNIIEQKIYERNLTGWSKYNDRKKFLDIEYPGKYSNGPLSFVRDNKFVKISPTKKMELDYENI